VTAIIIVIVILLSGWLTPSKMDVGFNRSKCFQLVEDEDLCLATNQSHMQVMRTRRRESMHLEGAGTHFVQAAAARARAKLGI
jgi:hypothetical protein